ncbi:MAG: hypothetical protein QXO16_05850 [Archaeoglobaceae archaeon]
MRSAIELADVMLQALTSFFDFLSKFFLYLRYTGNNETIVNASRGAYQSFWEIWYYSGAMIAWVRKMLTGENGFIDLINKNETLRGKLSEVVAIASKNATLIMGDTAGSNGLSFLLKIASERVSENPTFANSFWNLLTETVKLVSDALSYFPNYFPG